MLTRNHGAFLEQAVASVRQQSYPHWELLIGEDHSSDDTPWLAAQAASTDPTRITVLSSAHGALGFHRNFARLLARARGAYVAFLEGDDWWLSPTKLADQVALLSGDSSLSFCGGRTQVVDQRPASSCVPPNSRSTSTIGPPSGTERLGFEQLIDGYSFHFSSVMMRREAVQLPPWIYSQYCLDRPLYLLAASKGDAGVIDQVMSVYRLHGGGVWAPLSPLQRASRSRTLFGTFCRHFPRRHRPRFRRALSHILWGYLAEAIRQQQPLQTLAIVLMGVQAAPVLRLWEQPRPTAGALARVVLPCPRSNP